jgi:RHS repeat-associated protein
MRLKTTWAFLVTALLLAPSAFAGTLVFPPTSANNTQCATDDVPNNCGVVVFSGGHFVTNNGTTTYMGGQDFPSCVSGQVGWTFMNGPATDLGVVIENDAFKTDQSLKVETTDLVDGVFITKTQMVAFPGRDPQQSGATPPSTLVQTSGRAINSVLITIVNSFGQANFDEAAWQVLSMTVTQPVPPTIGLSIARNGDGTFAANIQYEFPAQSAPSSRSLSLELLPEGDQAGSTYFTRTDLSGSGVLVQQLGTFDTDRMIRAFATACDGSEEAEASVTGCGECKGPAKAVGGPVRLFDGVMTYGETDPLPATIGTEFRRQYASSTVTDGMFGTGWTSLFDASALPLGTDGASVRVVTEDRTAVVFRHISTGEWLQKWPMGGVAGTLTGSEQDGYIFREASGSVVRTFGTNHRLVRLQDLRRNRAVSVAYDASGNPTQVADERGNWSCAVTTSGGHVTSISVTGSPDLVWSYAYSGTSLTGVSAGAAGSPWRTYEYVSGQMSVIRDAAGSIIERHDYDAAGRATSSFGDTGDISAIQYPPSDANNVATTTVQRADGTQATYEQQFSAGEVVTGHADSGCSACGLSDATAAYDGQGNLVRLQNGRGYVTVSTFDVIGRHLIQTTTALTPSGCNPETDPAHCRLLSDALAVASLDLTAASETMNYAYADPNWPGNPTRIDHPSVIQSGGTATETFTYDAATGLVLVHTVTGAIDTAGTQESHVTTTTLYGSNEPAAFDPGGAFQSAWLPLGQPSGEKKLVDGPRTDVSDVNTFVYYPIDATVPGAWRGRMAAARNAAGHVIHFQDYDTFGHATTVIDANGVVTRTTFDALGRLLTSTVAGVPGCSTAVDPLCGTDLTTTRVYASLAGLLSSEQRPAGNLTTYVYDARGRLQTMTRGTASAALERIDYTYDPTTGKKATEVVSAFQNNAWVATKSESYAYTSDGNLRSVTHSDGTSVVDSYLPDGTLSSVQDERHTSANTSYSYDGANRMVSVTQTLVSAPGGQVATLYGYDSVGNLTSVTDPNGNLTTYVYDDFGRMQRQNSPVSGTTTYAYDLAGNLLSTTDANGATTSRVYDSLNRVTSVVTSRASASESVTSTYDDATPGNFGLGRLAMMSDPTGSTAYQYERRGLPRNESKTIGGATYTTTFGFDANGNRGTIGYPSGMLTQTTFDFADRPYSLTAGSTAIVTAATYLSFGPLTSLAFGNGTTRTMQYDARYRPLENKLTGPAGTIADYAYSEDAVGNITSIHDVVNPGYNRDLGYDDLNRLTTANGGTSLWGAGAYAYDAMGNMTSSALGTWKSTAATLVGSTPKLSSVVENGVSRGVSYDSVGSETAVGSAAYTYSPRNELTSEGNNIYAYDGRGVLTMATISVLSVSVVPPSATGGSSATATVTLSAPAASNTTILLSSDNGGVASVPAAVSVAAGGTTASFAVATSPVSTSTPVTITASFNQYAASAVVTILPPQLATVTISPASVASGGTSTGTVTLTGTAATNTSVTLSSDTAAATVPQSVTVAVGAASSTFPITTSASATNTVATITASLGGVTRQATLLVGVSELSSITVTPSSAINGGTFSAIVTLTNATPADMTVMLATTDSQVSLPPQITIPSGTSSSSFTINSALTGNGAATETITAMHGAVVRQATITVLPPSLSAFGVAPSTFVGGTVPLTGIATLTGSVPGPGWQLPVSSTDTTTVPPPPVISITTGASGQTRVLTRAVAATTTVTLSATDPTGISRSTAITVQAATVTISSLTLSASTVDAGTTATGTVTLTAAAPTGGVDVDLTIGNQGIAALPLYVRVAAGATTATFAITTTICSCQSGVVTISATHSVTTKTATLTVTEPTSKTGPLVAALTINPIVIKVGSSGTGTVSLDIPADHGGTSVSLSSSDPAAASVPSKISVPKGAVSGTFTVTAGTVAAATSVTITATVNNKKWFDAEKVTVYVVPANAVTLASMTLSPGSWTRETQPPVSGFGYVATITLTNPAPAGGAVVILGGSRDNVIAAPWNPDNLTPPPNSMTIAAGSTSDIALIQALPFLGTQRGTIVTATYNGVTLSQEASVQPQSARIATHETVQCASLALAPCLSTVAFTPRTSAFTPAATATGDTNGYYLYTPELHLLAETAVTASTAKPIAYAYLWFGDIPVASVEAATNTTRWYATDHLGTPFILTDAAGTAAWRAEYTPYGDVYTVRAGASLHQPLRFPGQLAQDGSSLNYNVFRWYRSGWGRYTQTDPIGITGGGVNLFNYVRANPLVLTDKFGLKCCPKDMFVNLQPINRLASAGLWEVTIRTRICATVANPGDCRFTQMAKTLKSSGPGLQARPPNDIYTADSPDEANVTISGKTICMADSPGRPVWSVSYGDAAPPGLMGGLEVGNYPFVDSAAFKTRIQDKSDRAQYIEREWGFAVTCPAPGNCHFSLWQ